MLLVNISCADSMIYVKEKEKFNNVERNYFYNWILFKVFGKKWSTGQVTWKQIFEKLTFHRDVAIVFIG